MEETTRQFFSGNIYFTLYTIDKLTFLFLKNNGSINRRFESEMNFTFIHEWKVALLLKIFINICRYGLSWKEKYKICSFKKEKQKKNLKIRKILFLNVWKTHLISILLISCSLTQLNAARRTIPRKLQFTDKMTETDFTDYYF